MSKDKVCKKHSRESCQRAAYGWFGIALFAARTTMVKAASFIIEYNPVILLVGFVLSIAAMVYCDLHEHYRMMILFLISASSCPAIAAVCVVKKMYERQ